MGTYDHKKVLLDYANGNITSEMALGHGLQHIDKLYEALTVANLSWYELRSKVDTLEDMVSTLQTEISHMTIFIEQSLSKGK